MRWLFLICILAGCAGPLEPGRLPTEEERCAFQGGSFRSGICHTRAVIADMPRPRPKSPVLESMGVFASRDWRVEARTEINIRNARRYVSSHKQC